MAASFGSNRIDPIRRNDVPGNCVRPAPSGFPVRGIVDRSAGHPRSRTFLNATLGTVTRF